MPAASATHQGEWRLPGAQDPQGATQPDVAPGRPDLDVARLAARQHGIVTARDLAAFGITGPMVTVRVRRGQLHPVFRGVYAVGHAVLSQTAFFMAAVLACGDGSVLSNHAAAAYHGMLKWHNGPVDVIVPRSAGRKIDGIRPHRCKLDPRDARRHAGLRVTTPARTILDLAATKPFKPLRRMVRQALAERKVDVRQVLDVLRRNPRRRGAATLRAVVANGPVPTRSDLEDLALDLLDSAEIERPEVNARLQLDGRAISPDLLYRKVDLAIELDSRRWHHDPLTQQDDADKQAILEAHGLRVLRITWWQIVNDPRQTIARIRAALAR